MEAIKISLNGDLYRNAIGKNLTFDKQWLGQSQLWLLKWLKSHFRQEIFFILCFKLHKEDIYVCIKQFRNQSYIDDFLVLSETAN